MLIVDGLELCYDIFGVLSVIDFPDWLIPVYSVSRGAKRSREIIKTLNKVCHRFPFDDVRNPDVSRDTQQVTKICIIPNNLPSSAGYNQGTGRDSRGVKLEKSPGRS